MENQRVMLNLLERLAPGGNDPTSERIWRFGERVAAVYEQQMEQFDQDEETSQWHRLYSADNMPEPSDTRNKTDVAAMMGFYSPTNFCKFQKLVTQQLLNWEASQTQLNPYPFGTSRITILDIGAGVGIASLATIDVLSTWADVVATLG
jgi:ribosomal protein RSM22 (predicted rRNA methylase)